MQDAEEKKIADDIYYSRKYPDQLDTQAKNIDHYRLNPDWHFIKIVPQGIWYFDTRYFGERRVDVPRNIWN